MTNDELYDLYTHGCLCMCVFICIYIYIYIYIYHVVILTTRKNVK